MPYNANFGRYNSSYNRGYSYMPECPDGMNKDYMFEGDDPRNNNCIMYITSPPQVETKEHYLWRSKRPRNVVHEKVSTSGIVMCVFGAVLGFIFMIMLGFNLSYREAGDSYWSTGILIVLLLGCIVMFVFGIIFCSDTSETDAAKAAIQLELNAYDALEPTKKYDPI